MLLSQKMHALRGNPIPTVPGALLFYLGVFVLWHFVLSFFQPDVPNIEYLKYAATAVSIYLIAKASLDPGFMGRALRFSDTAEITFLWAALVLSGVGAWALLVYLGALGNGELAVAHWRLISQKDFNEAQWSIPWIIADLLTVSFLNTITEEIIFRVFVLRRLRERYGASIAIVGSAALFGALHCDKSFIGAFLHGLVFAVVVIRMSSVYASILLHSLYNATVSVLRCFFGFSIVAEAKMLPSVNYWAPEFLCGIVGLGLMAVYFFASPFAPNTKQPNHLTLSPKA
jgi:membrane protease YdiL (CAAX protease family)